MMIGVSGASKVIILFKSLFSLRGVNVTTAEESRQSGLYPFFAAAKIGELKQARSAREAQTLPQERRRELPLYSVPILIGRFR